MNTSLPKINYALRMEETITQLAKEGKTPRLLLHSCCAPCSSAVIERLSPYFHLSILYYNPNIESAEEYEKRAAELSRFLHEFPCEKKVEYYKAPYDPSVYYEAVRGHEKDPEGGERCSVCFRLRLTEAALAAARIGADFFTTTLSISPLKNAQVLNRIGEEISEEYGIPYLHSDFKKKDGYRRSVQLSEEYHLYRQNYCGCVFSKEANGRTMGSK